MNKEIDAKENVKLNRGNLVRIKVGAYMWDERGIFDRLPEDVGKLAVVAYSYFEQYGGDISGLSKYSIVFLETGLSQSWYSPSQLELLDKGGEYLLRHLYYLKMDHQTRHSGVKK